MNTTFNSLSSFTNVEPKPPKLKFVLTKTGYSILLEYFIASSIVLTIFVGITFSSISNNFLLNNSLSSVITIVSIFVPNTLTPYFLNIPFFFNSIPQFNAV